MKKHFILGIMAVAALASCNKSEVLNQESLTEKGIAFDAYVGKPVQTKTTSINGENIYDAKIGILAWRTGNDDATDAKLADEAPIFMPNIPLTWDGTTGTYAPKRYWPSTGAKISFYAYAPYSDQQGSADAFNSKNITIQNYEKIYNSGSGNGGQHVITLKVPRLGDNPTTDATEDNYNSGNEYANHTDFLVSRKGNDANTAVGFNQNLNKDYEGETVKLQMKHALSKISFVAKAGNQATAYEDTRVIIDNIKIEGTFADKGSYNLFEEKWTIAQEDANNDGYKYENLVDDSKVTGYTVNTEKDPFTAIADELYNNGTEVTGMPGWYYLTDPTHDMMLIPFTYDATATDNIAPAKITKITGQYRVVSYDHTTNEKLETEGYTDIVPINVDVNLELEEGKSYIFKLNISLKAIEFEVDVEDWAESTEIDVTSAEITNKYSVTDQSSFESLLPEWWRETHAWMPGVTDLTLPWLVVEITPTPANELKVDVETPNGEKFEQIFTSTETFKVKLITISAEELNRVGYAQTSLESGDWKVTVNGKTTTITI